MIFILALALYAFTHDRIGIGGGHAITAPRTRVYGFVLLLLIFPARWALNAIVVTTMPPDWLGDPIHFAILNTVFLIVYVYGLALLFRDREAAA